MVTPQFVFMVMGITSFVVAAILLVVSVFYFVRNDVRGVMDDLSGKTRQVGASQGPRPRRRASWARQTGRESMAPQAGIPFSVQQSTAMGQAGRQTPVSQSVEDDLDTVLDTKLRRVAANYGGVSSDIQDVNDGIPTLVTSVGEYHRNNMSEMNLGDADSPTMVESAEDGMPTQMESRSAAYDSRFVVTKSILAIHSKEVIAVG